MKYWLKLRKTFPQLRKVIKDIFLLSYVWYVMGVTMVISLQHTLSPSVMSVKGLFLEREVLLYTLSCVSTAAWQASEVCEILSTNLLV